MRTANLNTFYSRSSHTHRLTHRTSCQSCYCYVYFAHLADVVHDAELVCSACTAASGARVTSLSLVCTACDDTLCPVEGHTTQAQREAALCTDCFFARMPAKQVEYAKPVTVQGSCAICLGEQSVHTSVQLPCEHVFHTQCIGQWLNRCDTCPLCRQNVCQIN